MNKIIEEEFNKLITLANHNEESLKKLVYNEIDDSFDTLYQLCKSFVDEVDNCVKEGISFNENNLEEELG